MLFSDLALSRRLERAEGHACRQFAEARRRLFPECGSCWMECAGAQVVFDGVNSPVTQTFGLGIFEELTDASLDTIERFFLDRGAHVDHEVSPLAGVAALRLLCARQYRPIEISSVMVRPVENPPPHDTGDIKVRVASPEEADLWAEVSARGWTHDHPEFKALGKQFGAIAFAREHGPASSPSLTANPAPRDRFGSTTASPSSPEPRPSRRCAVEDCNRLCFRSGCATSSTMAATSP